MKKYFPFTTTLYILFVLSVFITQTAFTQPWMEAPYLQIKGPDDDWKQFNLYEIQKAYAAYEEDYRDLHPNINLRTDVDNEEDEDAVPGSFQFRRWENFMFKRVYPTGDIRVTDKTWDNFQEYLKSKHQNLQRNAFSTTINWSSLGPSSTNNGSYRPYVGRVNFIKFNPQNNSDLWIGSPTGGLWHSTDDGNTWSTNTDQLASLLTSDLAIDPANPSIMYLATGDCDAYARSIGVLKTIDGGQTWNTTGLSFNLSAGNGVQINRLLINPLNPNTLFAVTSHGIYRTYNAGANWALFVTSGAYEDIKYKPGDTTVVYTCKSGAFYVSTDGGSSFNQITSGLLGSITSGRFCIGVTPVNPSVVYLLHCYSANFNAMLKSTDNGNNFTTQSTSPNITGPQGYFAAALAVNPANEADLYVGGISYYHSTDSGVTWQAMNTTNTHVDVHRIEFLPGSSSTLFACHDGGLSKSIDNAVSAWIDLTPGLSISQIYRVANSSINHDWVLAGHQDNGTTFLNASGWRTVNGGDGATCLFDHTDQDIAYTSTNNGDFFKTTNASTTFTPGIPPFIQSTGTGINAKGPWCTPLTMHPTDHNTLILGKNEVYISINGGTNWTMMPGVTIAANPFFPFGIEFLEFAPSDPNYIYAVNFQKFYVCDNGNTFIDRSNLRDSSNLLTGVAISSTNPQHVWVCNSGYTGPRVVVSNDAGLTWADYSTGLPDIPCSDIISFSGTTDGLFLAMDIGVYYRDASMSSWQLINMNLPNARVFDLSIQNSTGKLRAGLFGRGVWEADILSVGINEPSKSTSINIYPNPSLGKLKITMQGSWKYQNCLLSVFSVLGQVIISDKITSPILEVNTEKWTSGVYYAKISEGNDVVVKKIIIQ